MFSEWWWSSGAEANKEDGFEIPNSLRFRGNAWLERAFTASNLSKLTLSFWYKNPVEDYAGTTWIWAKQGSDGLDSGSISLQNTAFGGADDWTIKFKDNPNTNYGGTRKYRDPSAWYHFVYKFDAPNGVIELFVNGQRETSTSIATSATSEFFARSPIQIGAYALPASNTGNRLRGYLSDFYAIDGQALEPTAFGRELTTGQWVPREVDFTPATMRYSDYLTVTPGGVFEGGRPATACF